MNRLTVGILTLNEERRIASCLRSCAFADQIVVVDSGSTDRTVEIAREMGAEVFVHADWQGFGPQRNHLLAHSNGDYIFFLDADEEITPELQAEIQAAVASGDDAVWEVMWNQVAYGRPLTLMRSTGGVQRMFRMASLSHYEGVVHEHAAMRPGDRPVRRFKSRLLHYSRETIHGSLVKLAQYAQLGAAKRARAGKKGGVLRGMASAFGNFTRLYIFQRGFLCGPQGFLFCFFIALECFFRYAALEYDKEYLQALSKRS
jgi:glycosyltransferase involved in cell wall biosynthesis